MRAKSSFRVVLVFFKSRAPIEQILSHEMLFIIRWLKKQMFPEGLEHQNQP